MSYNQRPRDKSQDVCRKCGWTGHWAVDCRVSPAKYKRQSYNRNSRY